VHGVLRIVRGVESAAQFILDRFHPETRLRALSWTFIAILIWLGVVWTIRTLSVLQTARSQTRAEERVRILRDLYDTLLQDVQGVLLSFHAAAQKVPFDHESRQALEKALACADRIVLDGRDRIQRLK
jgi:signal transduction histidine kinase